MRTLLWTATAVVFGLIALARHAWRKARGPGESRIARLPGGNLRPGRSWRR
ncbi:hypothetical protein [Actinacidiphila glaucinigra]|uniref:hypothetical protein n=1 Tax=Actinacidiphila glaucinigra TaxID=235986 RepID=UPI003670A0B0